MNTILSKQRYAALLLAVLLLTAVTMSVQARSLPDFTRLAEQNSPSVVNISTKQSKSVTSRFKREFQIPDLPEESPFNDLFKHFFGDDLKRDAPREYNTQSLGSGFIISEDGYVMTNYHVVKDADEIIVRLSDYREYIAELIGTDQRSDIALLKIDAKDLPRVKIGSGNKLKVGEWVLAIGSPFGFDHSVTAGIVSAMGRSLPNENYIPFIQTDVAINPGNSGGPLINLEGEVVGINSQIYSRTGGFMGLSFAIPIEMAMNVVEQLRTKGKVSRGWLGVLIQDVTRELADSFGMKHPRGALVARVLPGSPAEQAGIETGDVIIEYNGKELVSSSMLPPLVGTSRVDKPAELVVLRNGKRKTFSVTVGELPEDEEVAQVTAEPNEESGNLLGLTVADITSEIKRKYDLGTSNGVIVREVAQGPAKNAGIRSGDIIQMLNNTRIENVAEFKQQLDKLPKGKTVAVLVYRTTGPIFLAMRIPE